MQQKHTRNIGRPTKSVKKMWLKCRIDFETYDMLEKCADKLQKNKSEATRFAIKKLYKFCLKNAGGVL